MAIVPASALNYQTPSAESMTGFANAIDKLLSDLSSSLFAIEGTIFAEGESKGEAPRAVPNGLVRGLSDSVERLKSANDRLNRIVATIG